MTPWFLRSALVCCRIWNKITRPTVRIYSTATRRCADSSSHLPHFLYVSAISTMAGTGGDLSPFALSIGTTHPCSQLICAQGETMRNMVTQQPTGYRRVVVMGSQCKQTAEKVRRGVGANAKGGGGQMQ